MDQESPNEKDDDSEYDSDKDSEYDDQTVNIMTKIFDLKHQLIEFPELLQLKSDLNNECLSFNPSIIRQQHLQLNIFKTIQIQHQINMYKLQLLIKCMPDEVWNQYYDSTTKTISKQMENFEKLPKQSQFKLKKFASRDSLPTSLMNPPWYHYTYRRVLIEIQTKMMT